MKVSIITVAYNSAATISDTLASVAAQRHPLIEQIVIDGASTDHTLDVVRQSSCSIAHVVSEPDKGIYDAMNKGLRMATGDFVGFLNADDMLAAPDSIERIAAAADSQVDVVYGDLVYVEAANTERVIRYWRSGAFTNRGLRFGWMPPHPTLYVRRTLLQELGGFDTTFSISADYDFMLRVLNAPGIRTRYVPHVLVRMRAGGASNSSMRAMWRKSSEDLLALRRHHIGGLGTLACKNLRKLPQFLAKPPRL